MARSRLTELARSHLAPSHHTELLDLLLSPGWDGMSYPIWEHSARYFANPMLIWPSVVSCHVPVRSVAGQAQNQATQEPGTPRSDEAATKQ